MLFLILINDLALLCVLPFLSYFIAGNLLIIRSIVGFPEMRSATNYFLASLAVADLCITSVLPAKAVETCFIVVK